jgi:hypothetical protein
VLYWFVITGSCNNRHGIVQLGVILLFSVAAPFITTGQPWAQKIWRMTTRRRAKR